MNLHRKREREKKFLKRNIFKRKKRKRKKERERRLLNESLFITAPERFSIFENFEETYKVLEMILNYGRNQKGIILNMNNVIELTNDTLMYLKHIGFYLKGICKRNLNLYYTWPENGCVRELVNKSGFYRSNSYLTVSYEEINCGNMVDTKLIAKIIDILMEKTKKTRVELSYLYTCLSEMMENTLSHAYEEYKIEEKFWYLSMKIGKDRIYFIFLDTGDGIPKTINSKLFDKIPFFSSQSKLLLSALRGEERTRTKQDNRGKGLPDIYKMATESVTNMKILSNKACYNLNKNNDLLSEFKGTLYYWEIEI